MQKNVEKMIYDYSPNFNSLKRNKKLIKYLIFHYTGMKSEKDAIKKLTDYNSNVSCHYYITKLGRVIQMVPDLYIAWHAGKSKWKKDISLNKNSIGIEVSNPGHGNGYIKFSNRQIRSLVKLTKILIKKYKIRKVNILGHSDIAPLRKKDPGEKFPWKNLSKKQIGIWHNIDEKLCKKMRRIKINNERYLIQLKKFGYIQNTYNSMQLKKIIKSFQRRFRPQLINGIIDKECFMILKSLNSLN